MALLPCGGGAKCSTRVGALRPLVPRTRFEPAAVLEIAHLQKGNKHDCCISSAPNPGPCQLRARCRGRWCWVLPPCVGPWTGNIAVPVSCMSHCLNSSRACVVIARAVPSQLQRRGRPCACSESDAGRGAACATNAMGDTLIIAWCCVVRVLSVLRVVGASSSFPWTCSRCGWRDWYPAAGALPDTRTVGPLPSPKHPISVR